MGHRFVVAGRDAEIGTLSGDIERVSRGRNLVRLLLGPSGSGTTFLLGAARAMALDQRVVAASANLTSDLRLSGERGQVTRLYRAAVASLSTRVHPDGGALRKVVDRLVDVATIEARAVGLDRELQFRRRLSGLAALPGGAAFGAVVFEACRAPLRGDVAATDDAYAWLGGSPDAGRVLRIAPTLSDICAWDQLRLLARLCRLAGFGGLVLFLDHADSIARLRNPTARTDNLTRLGQLHASDSAGGLGVVLAGASEPFERAGLLPRPDAWSGADPTLQVSPLDRPARLALLRQVEQLHGGGLNESTRAAIEARHVDLGELLQVAVRTLDGQPQAAVGPLTASR